MGTAKASTNNSGSSSTPPSASPAQPAADDANQGGRYTITVSCRVEGDVASVSFTTFKRTLIQQIWESSCAFFKQNPTQKHAQLVIGGSVKQAISFTRETTVEDHNLLIPERQALELVLSEEPEVCFPCVDQYGNSGILRAWLYHPFLEAVKRMCEDAEVLFCNDDAHGGGGSGGGTGSSCINCPLSPQQPLLDVDLYHSSDVSLISLQNSPAACGLQGGEPLLLYRYGRCSREYWQQQDMPERAAKPSFVGIYFSDYKNQNQGRTVFRHDLSMPLDPLLTTYCKWRGLDLRRASFLWLQFYMRLDLHDTGIAQGLDDGDHIHVFDKQDLQGRLWDAVLDNNIKAAEAALDAGATLTGPDGSFEANAMRWPLHSAAANNHCEMARLLVKRGADVDKLDAVSEPALWHAVEQGHPQMVELLLELGATATDLSAPPNKPKADYAALCHAAEKGSLPMVQLLLAKGANPYAFDDTGYCAYDYLVDQAKPLELLKALLAADPAFASTQRHYQQAYQRLCAAVKRAQRYPALGCSCRTCNSVVEVRAAEAEATQTLKAQIGCVALVRAVQAGGPHCLEAMQLLQAKGALLDGQDQDGRTALHQAIRYNRIAEAKWLISAGAHLDVADFEGLLPLHQAACTGNVELAKLLAEAGASINLHTVKYITQESLEAQTKKHEASQNGRKSVKKRSALDITGLTTIGGNSALALAVRHGHANVVDYLLCQGATFDLKNPADSSAFHAALDRGAASVASKLLQHLNKPKVNNKALPAASNSTTLSTTKAKPKVDKEVKEKEKASAQRKQQQQQQQQAEAAANGGEVPKVEPALALEAGAGLKQMVALEREQMRQQLGLSKGPPADSGNGASPTSRSGASVGKAPSLMEQLAASKAAAAAAAEKQRQQAEAAAAQKAKQQQEEQARAAAAAEAAKQREEQAKQEEKVREEEEAATKAAEAAKAAETAKAAKVEAEKETAAGKAASTRQQQASQPAESQQQPGSAQRTPPHTPNKAQQQPNAAAQSNGGVVRSPANAPKQQQAKQQLQPQQQAGNKGAAASKPAMAPPPPPPPGPPPPKRGAALAAPPFSATSEAGSDVSADSAAGTKPGGVQILYRSTFASNASSANSGSAASKAVPVPSVPPPPASQQPQKKDSGSQQQQQPAVLHPAHANSNAGTSRKSKKGRQVLSLEELTVLSAAGGASVEGEHQPSNQGQKQQQQGAGKAAPSSQSQQQRGIAGLEQGSNNSGVAAQGQQQQQQDSWPAGNGPRAVQGGSKEQGGEDFPSLMPHPHSDKQANASNRGPAAAPPASSTPQQQGPPSCTQPASANIARQQQWQQQQQQVHAAHQFPNTSASPVDQGILLHVPAASTPLSMAAASLPPYTSGSMQPPLTSMPISAPMQPPHGGPSQHSSSLLAVSAAMATSTHMLAPPRPLSELSAAAARSPVAAEEHGAMMWDMGRFESMVMSVVAEEGAGGGPSLQQQQQQPNSPQPQSQLPSSQQQHLPPNSQSLPSHSFPQHGAHVSGGFSALGMASNGPEAAVLSVLAAEGPAAASGVGHSSPLQAWPSGSSFADSSQSLPAVPSIPGLSDLTTPSATGVQSSAPATSAVDPSTLLPQPPLGLMDDSTAAAMAAAASGAPASAALSSAPVSLLQDVWGVAGGGSDSGVGSSSLTTQPALPATSLAPTSSPKDAEAAWLMQQVLQLPNGQTLPASSQPLQQVPTLWPWGSSATDPQQQQGGVPGAHSSSRMASQQPASSQPLSSGLGPQGGPMPASLPNYRHQQQQDAGLPRKLDPLLQLPASLFEDDDLGFSSAGPPAGNDLRPHNPPIMSLVPQAAAVAAPPGKLGMGAGAKGAGAEGNSTGGVLPPRPGSSALPVRPPPGVRGGGHQRSASGGGGVDGGPAAAPTPARGATLARTASALPNGFAAQPPPPPPQSHNYYAFNGLDLYGGPGGPWMPPPPPPPGLAGAAAAFMPSMYAPGGPAAPASATGFWPPPRPPHADPTQLVPQPHAHRGGRMGGHARSYRA